jgi:hypothetical protein
MAVPPARAFAQVADFRSWLAWSPWEGIDPAMQRIYSSATSGVGATYRWTGNNKIGEGMMTITEVRPGEHIGIDIEFFRPFKAKNRVTFDFAATGPGATVTWTMLGRNSFLGKAMSLVMNCETMIGGPFEKGLAKLKTVSEAGGAPTTTGAS